MTWGHSSRLFIKFVTNIFIGPLTISKVASELNQYKRWKVILYTCTTVTFFISFIACHLLGPLLNEGLWAVGWFSYAAYATISAKVRYQVRRVAFINGNVFEDFFASLFFYPNVAVQLDETIGALMAKDKLQIKDREKHTSNV